MAWKNKRPRPVAVLIPGYNICKICDDASPRFFVRLDSIRGFCVFGANSEGPVGSQWPEKISGPGLSQYSFQGTIYAKSAMTQVLDFLWGSIQYEDFAFLGLIQRDLWGPLWSQKLSGHGLSQYLFQGTIYAKSAMTQFLVILGGFSENRFFGTFQIL